MPPSHEHDREEFQGQLDGLANNSTLPLMPREYPGPIVISHAITLDGQGSTIWALNGPVLSCQVSGITLRNLRIEVTGEVDTVRSEDHCALRVEQGCTPTLENVEIRGSVIGMPEEEGDWRYPRALPIGSISFGIEHDLIMRIWAPVPCEISSKISGLEVQPHRLEPGTNEVTLHIERISKDTLLSGHLYITTPHLRRAITVSGYISTSKVKKSRSKKTTEPSIIYQPSDWEMLLARPRPQVAMRLPPPPPPPPDPSSIILPDQNQLGLDAHIETETSRELTKPSGPNIDWPPPPPPPTPPFKPEDSSRPIIQPGPVPVPGPRPFPPRSYKKLVIVGIGTVFVLALMAFAVRWFWFGSTIEPARIKQLRILTTQDEVEAVAFSPDGKTLASGSKDGIIKIWNVSTGELQTQLPTKHSGAITSLAFSHNGKLLASGSTDVNVILWDLQEIGQVKGKTPLRDQVTSVAFSPDDSTVACGVSDGTIRFLDGQNGQQQSLRLPHGSPVKSVAFSRDGIVASGGDDGTVKLWDPVTKAETPKKQLSPNHNGAVLSLAFSYDGKILATGGADRQLILWDVETGQRKPVSPFMHTDQVASIAFSADNKFVVSGGGGRDSTVRLWDVEEGGTPKKLLVDHTGAVNTVAVSSGGKIASGSSDKTIRLWGSE